jgi:glycosyltransferase involved in cell wall biosynthesis
MEQVPTLVVAGSGALRGSLEHELAMLGVRVRFLAWVPHDELLRLLARCTLLLFPSAWGEPLSRVLLEAAALGVPVLAMPTGGTPDIIRDGETGLFARTPQQFAHRLLWLLGHDQERHRLGAGARATAQQHFSVEAVLPQVEQLYSSLHSKDKSE